ncbi:MAG: 30S ribosomal protein S17 [Polyangiaceae bacterium]|nr:30S ribosomal protein S17 [Polyangiaceae bacterium]
MSQEASNASAALEGATQVSHKAHGFRRKMIGRVIKGKMNKTVVVECVTAHRDPLYGKYIRRRTRYQAHDETNQYKVGDEVEIEEHRPISRHKRFVVVRLVKKFVEE